MLKYYSKTFRLQTISSLIITFGNIFIQVAVLYGYGGTFCSGYDLQETASSAQNNVVSETLGLSDNFNPFNTKGAGPLGPTRRFFSKPVIAAVSGYAVAGGFELALACDLRVVEEFSVFGVFCRRFGVPLIDGGTGANL